MDTNTAQATSTELTIPFSEAKKVTTDFMNPVVWTQMKGMAQTFFESKAIPAAIKNVPQLMMVLQAGLEMGMPPVEAMGSFYSVNGTLNLWGKALVKRLRAHGYTIQYKDEDPGVKVTAVVKRGEEEYSETYTFDMAEKSGYTKSNGSYKVGWMPGVNRILKLRYGALNLSMKTYIPDVLGSTNGIVEVEEDAVIPAEPEAPKDTQPQKEPATAAKTDLKAFLESQKEKKAPAKPAKEKKIEDAEVVSDKPESPAPIPPTDTTPTPAPEKPSEQVTDEKVEAQRLRRAIVDLGDKEFGMGPNEVVDAVKKKYGVGVFDAVTLAQLQEYYGAMQKGVME